MPSLVHLAVFSASVSLAQRLQAVEFEPGDWLGIDGNWSTVKLMVGSPRQFVSVLASTSLSELWAVGPGGCPERLWQLGLDYLGYGGNGQYGFDSLNARIPAAGSDGPGGGPGGGSGGNPGPRSGPNAGSGRTMFRMPKALMAAINTTDYWTGLFGLGVNPGTFGRKTAQSPLIQAVQTYGLIPSYTYGYTAGASYKNAPVSLTLGGDFMNSGSNYNFTFAFSSIDNHDNFGKPLEAPGVVNITLPIQAFIGLLQSFLQEAYIVTKYDFGIFKLFQSQFTSRRLARIIAIKRPNGSPYPPPPKKSRQSDDLNTAQIIGLVVGAEIVSFAHPGQDDAK
ncbi:hypothetical protein ESCO_005169 [Escovopsis weberi]|uniref:Peptidase A1 domain-containing protein n=1 Tax=Escovopsis weberi TaxID=150374 RepID=A0A0M9VW02_ESCWE|nr:hypothetical protein ESCO_005169 [Escovopsis weberi]